MINRSFSLAGAIALIAALFAGTLQAEVCNVKVVTDANPDYSDVGSMIHSIASKWTSDKEKCWAIWYWNNIARRQTAPFKFHGSELTDPIRQFNDYGYAMCSTVAGVNCSIWGAMGYKVKFWDISMHTVCEVEYDGAYHMYDSSMSAIYTRCDGVTLAGVPEIGADGACEASGGKNEPGHIAKYHCLTATSKNGYLTGADCPRDLAQEYRCFNPRGLKYRYYFNNWSLGHRFILNLRDGEVYTRYYSRLDADSKDAVVQTDKKPGYKADPAYFVPNGDKDPEAVNPRYHIRGNGLRTFAPALTNAELMKVVDAMSGLRVVEPSGLEPAEAGKPGEVVFRVEGANVITSMTIKAAFERKAADDVNAVSVSTNNGLKWTEVWKNANVGDTPVALKLTDQVNGAYEVLVKVQLAGKANASDARLKSIAFETVTMLNGKTQPQLKLGKNTVYVGTGEQTGSVVIFPELQNDRYKEFAVDEKNIACIEKGIGYLGALRGTVANEDAYVTFRVDTPGDMTRITYGGRFYNRGKSRCEIHYSFDDGKTWTKGYSLTDTTPPWDVIHYEKADVPAGCRSALVKYVLHGNNPDDSGGRATLYSARIEANYKPADATFKPIEVTFDWSERQKDLSLVKRSHTQLVEKVPFTYEINVGGADHPIVNSLRSNLKGAVADVKSGYSDGKDVGGEKFVERWVTYGTNFAEGKPYTCSAESLTNWGAGDPTGKALTDGIVGAPYTGGSTFRGQMLFAQGSEPVITVDLGDAKKCGAFRIQVAGFPWWDALVGNIKDQVEVFTSLDGEKFDSVGSFNFTVRRKDIAANHMIPDDETMTGNNFELILDKPVEARYVRFNLKPARGMMVSEVQALDFIKYDAFDLRIALPDGKDRSDITQYNPKHTPSQPYKRPN